MTTGTITVAYSCPACGLVNVQVPVPERAIGEDVVLWMNATVALVGAHHRTASPDCHPKTLKDLKIPTTGRRFIGGPVVQ